ncbi:unnamed protein product, partial [Cylicostephanus goldi]
HCRNFPDQKFFRPEDVAFDLQRKYFEYSRKKYKPFVAIVREGLNRLNIKDSPEPEVAKVEEVEVVNEPDIAVVREVISPATAAKNERKRKAQSFIVSELIDPFCSSTSSTPKVEDVYVSSDEENDKQFEDIKTPNRANKSILNLYNSAKKMESSPVLNTTTSAPSKKKRAAGAVKSTVNAHTNSPSAAPRGLGNVPTLAVQPRPSPVKFEDLGGCDRQFLEVCRLAMHMKRPHTYNVLGVEPPKGFLVHGPPGCGKTLFAQAVAGEFDLPMIQLAATELVSGVSGDTEEKIRQLFIIAKQSAPCVLVS